MQVSGVVVKAKQSQFRPKKQNVRRMKNSAIMGVHLSTLRKRLEKMGVYSDERFEEEKRKLKQTIKL
ncbi:MAG: hypothetical protein AAB463_02290 [Patescibacteria group bacterium]